MLGFVVCLLIRSLGAPGDLDSTCSKADIYRGNDLVRCADGTFWAAGFGEVVHLSTEGEELHRLSHDGRRHRLTPHPLGGVVMSLPSGFIWWTAEGKEVEDFNPPPCNSCELYSAGGRLWMAYDRKLVALDSAGAVIPGYSFDYGFVNNVVRGVGEGVVVVLGLKGGGGKLTLTTLSAEGAILDEVNVQHAALYNDALLCLSDGRFLMAGSQGVARLLPSGEFDPNYRSPSGRSCRDVILARRPDGRIMLAMMSGAIGDLVVGARNGFFILARLTENGEIDESFPASPIRGQLGGLVATNDWAYTLSLWFGRSNRLYRIDSRERALPPSLVEAEGGCILTGEQLKGLGNASLCAMARGDGFDDLILASGHSSDGLRRLVNSSGAETEWREVAILDGVNEPAFRRIVTGRLNGDAWTDVIEWRHPQVIDEKWSVHWYQGQEEGGRRSLAYAGLLKVTEDAGMGSLDVRLADVDGDGVVRYHQPPYVRGRNRGDDPPRLSWWRNDGVATALKESVIGELKDV